MKKGFLCILLSLLMILPLLTACGNKEADLSGSEVSIYTLYTIVDEATSPEAIRQVELSLNRILFYRLGVILDLQMVTEDEYDEFINNKLTELDNYVADKANNPYAANAEDPEKMTGDRVLDMLENNEDIVLKRPRVDIFLVRGYENYYSLASEGKLAKVDERLENEAKELKSQIHSTLLNAAKVNGWTYGFPINTAVGEYTYMVFDKKITDDIGINLSTVKTLADIEGFLGDVKAKTDKNDVENYDENYEGIIPLLNTGLPEGINFIINDGFPALVTSTGQVTQAYDSKNKQLNAFFSLVAKYNANGYIAKNPSEDARCAVRVETGSKDEIIKRLGGSEKDYEFVQYAPPIATTANTVKNLFCIPASVVSNELTDVVNIINEINTDADLMNLLTYGIQKTHGVEISHYELNDKNQVERNEENLYVVDPQYIGNCFITHTLAGEDPNKWNNQIEQNKIAIPSPSLGFTMTPVEFEYTEIVENEDGTTTEKLVKISEPDFVAIINSIVDKYYPNLVDGSFLIESGFDYAATFDSNYTSIRNSLIGKLDEKYSGMLKLQFQDEELKRLQGLKDSDPEYQKYVSEAESLVISEDLSDAITYFEKTLGYDVFDPAEEEASESSEVIESEATDSSIESEDSSEADDTSASEETEEDEVERITKEDVITRIDEYYESIATSKDDRVAAELKELFITKAKAKGDASVGTSAFNNRFATLKASDEYKRDLESLENDYLSQKLNSTIDELIKAEVEKYTATMIDEINVEIKSAVRKFVLDYAEKCKTVEDSESSEETSDDASTDTDSTSSEIEVSLEGAADDIFVGEEINDEYLAEIKEKVLLGIGFYVKTTVEPDSDSSEDTSDDATSDEDSSGSESSDTTDEITESDDSSIADSTTTESTDASEVPDTSDDTTSEGEDGSEEDQAPVEVITKPYKTWLDFVVLGRVASAFNPAK